MGKAAAPILTITARTDRWTSGVTGVTRRGSHTREHGRPLPMLYRTATGGYKAKPKFHGVSKGFGVAHSTDSISRTT
jgi:hypothetical protein